MKSFYISIYESIIDSFLSLEEDIKVISATTVIGSDLTAMAVWQKKYRELANPIWLVQQPSSTCTHVDMIHNECISVSMMEDTNELDELALEFEEELINDIITDDNMEDILGDELDDFLHEY